MSKVGKGKGNMCNKNGKTAKCAEEQDNRQLSIYDLWQFVMFCIKVGT